MLKKHSWCKATARNGLQWAFERILPERLVTDHPEDRRARDLARRVQWRRSGITPDEVAGLVDGGAMRFSLMPDREAIEEMRAERGRRQRSRPAWWSRPRRRSRERRPSERLGGLDRGELRKGAARAVAVGPRRRERRPADGEGPGALRLRHRRRVGAVPDALPER